MDAQARQEMVNFLTHLQNEVNRLRAKIQTEEGMIPSVNKFISKSFFLHQASQQASQPWFDSQRLLINQFEKVFFCRSIAQW